MRERLFFVALFLHRGFYLPMLERNRGSQLRSQWLFAICPLWTAGITYHMRDDVHACM